MNYFSHFLAGAFSVSAVVGGAIASPANATRPNILLIISDDQRWDALGAAGNPAIHTPALDRLAAEGVYFRQGTIHTSLCMPSRATLLTGLPPHQHGWYSNQSQRPGLRSANGFKGIATLPGLLEPAGYRTVLVGKWHLTPVPWNCGFSDVRTWFPRGDGPYVDLPLARGKSPETRVVKGFVTEVFADDAIEFLKSDAAKEKPFLLWLATTAPHWPRQPNPDRIQKLYAGKSAQDLLPPGVPSAESSSADWTNYCAAITHLDEQVGRLLATLENQKLADKTVVVFLGDNGYMMGERGWDGKVMPYESSVRVPFIVRAPMLPQRKGRSDAAVSSLDLPATLLSVAGVSPPKEWPGRNLVPLLRGGKASGFDEAICEFADEAGRNFGHLTYRLIRTPAHKLIRWRDPQKPDELYDLMADPHEQNNLANAPAARRVRDDLLQRLQAWMERTSDPARQWNK